MATTQALFRAVFAPFLLLLLQALHVAAGSVTIQSISEVIEQRDCVRSCLGYGYGQKLPAALGCADSDSCICRANVRPYASSYIESCVQTAYTTCNDGVDYTIAVSLYDGYCTFTAPATVVVTQTPDATWNNQPQTVTLFTSPPTATVTVFSSDAAPSSSEWFLAVAVASLAVLFVDWS